MRVNVKYGRIPVDVALRCTACGGDGRAAIFTGRPECRECGGTGRDVHQRGYCYDTGDEVVSLGDIVLVPGTWVHPEMQEATVVNLESGYSGTAVRIVNVIERVGA